MINFIFFGLFLLLSSCVHGPAQEKKSNANYLSGHHYQQTANVLGVPIIERSIVNTVISGRISLNDPLALLGSNAKVQLLQNDKVVATGPVTGDNNFKIVENISKGTYVLRLVSAAFLGEKSVEVNSDLVGDVLISAARKK
jgi:hypothetical protein